MSDLISRQTAIDALERKKDKTAKGDIGNFYNTIIQNNIDEIKSLPHAQPNQRWTPVAEGLPEKKEKKYWICTDSKYQCQAKWTNDRYGFGRLSEYWGWVGIPQYTTVVAWMPLPEPYKEEKKK